MLSFRGKIVFSYICILLFFVGVLYPFANKIVKDIATESMQRRAKELIGKIHSAPDDDALVRRLRDQKHLIFFRISIINQKRQLLYDSHASRILGNKYNRLYVVDHPEVNQAFKTGSGYYEDYSELLQQRFAYVAQSFPFQDSTYVIRVAFPFEFVSEMTRDFSMGFLIIGGAVLLLFSVMTLIIVHHFSSPIQQIIDVIRRYEKGGETKLPKIHLHSVSPGDDFDRLAKTLNSLSERVRSQIATLVQERNEKEAVLSSLVEGVVAVDRNLRIIYANESTYKLLSLTENVEGASVEKIGVATASSLLRDCQKSKKVIVTDYESTAGPARALELIAAPKADDGAVLLIQDKSLHNSVMEMGKDFIANASHELRTPITIIRGFAETLHENPDLPPSTASEITHKIVKNCDRMAEVVKTLLTLSGIEKLPTSRYKPCDILPIIQHCEELIKGVYPDAKVQIVADQYNHYTVLGDSSMLELAFYNLLNNAGRYSDGPANITVELKALGHEITVIISDQGIGIPESELNHIFMRFYTVDKAHSQRAGGTGLGLALVQTIVDKHQGKISVRSRLGKGSVFTVTLPLK